jgi:hypothetical protein
MDIYATIFDYFGLFDRGLSPSDIEEALPARIAAWRAQIGGGAQYGDNEAKNIEVVEHAYASAEPNRWIVIARWRIKQP